jgi:hypothetical protein
MFAGIREAVPAFKMRAMTPTNVASHPSPPAGSFSALPSDHRFFSGIAVAAAIVIVAGFASTYGPKIVNGDPTLLPIIHVHAAIFASWLVVFVTQNILVLRGRVAVHRKLGPWAVALAMVMLLVGVATAIAVARTGHRGIPGVEFPDAGGFLLLNLAAVTVFTVLVIAGWYWRRSPQAHKRLMLMATTGGLIGPGASRLGSGNAAIIGPLVFAFILAGPAYDLVTRRRVHPAYLWTLPLVIIGLPPVVGPIASTSAWKVIAAWLVG